MFGSLLKPAANTSLVPERVDAATPGPLRRPAVRIHESDTSYDLAADMPGVPSSAVEIIIDKGVLTLRGKSLAKVPLQGESLYREYESGTFERSFELPNSIDADGIHARSLHGQVLVTLPKMKAAQPRRIPVTSG